MVDGGHLKEFIPVEALLQDFQDSMYLILWALHVIHSLFHNLVPSLIFCGCCSKVELRASILLEFRNDPRRGHKSPPLLAGGSREKKKKGGEESEDSNPGPPDAVDAQSSIFVYDRA